MDTYEKKYKEALERAKNLMAMYPQDAPGYKEVFPELRESEEEYGRLFDIEHYLDGTLQLSPDRRIACIDFLKSLRHWKPSEEQMEALYEAAQDAAIDRESGNALYELYEQLKKL